MATIFKGFSTVNKVKAPYTLTDMALVKQDLLNEFNTRKGERVMRPNFGSIIWDLLMNPDDSFTTDEIKLDIERIIAKESRVQLVDITLFSSDHSVRAEIEFNYIILNSAETLFVEFNREQQV